MRRFLLLLTLATLPASALAETVYRWLDSQGSVHYGGKPPAGARQVQRIQGDAGVNVIAPKTNPEGAATPSNPAKAEAADPEQAFRAKAREQLQRELDTARLSLINALQAYESGRAVRYGNERNYVRYLERVDALEAQVRLAQERVLLLERQMQSIASQPAQTPAVSGQQHAP